MKVQIGKKEGCHLYVQVTANEIIYKPETIESWIRQLRIAKAWLAKKGEKK